MLLLRGGGVRNRVGERGESDAERNLLVCGVR